MLYIALLLTLLLLGIANWAAHYAKAPLVVVMVWSLIFAFFAPSPTPTILQGFLLCMALLIWRQSGRGNRVFLPLSLAATMIAYSHVGWAVLKKERMYAELRAQFPYQSMEERLPARMPAPYEWELAADTSRRLDTLEESMDPLRGHRAIRLKRLHEHATRLFINNPGFGVARMVYPSQEAISIGLREEVSVPQPGNRLRSSLSSEQPSAGARDWDQTALNNLHETSYLDFVHPQGFGFFKDRQHVAGFQAHQFSATPQSAKNWTLQTLDLVSLLLHEEPIAYISASLPRMDELREAPTRALDTFETSGLMELRRGDDLVVRSFSDGLRLLGALRSTQQCLSCHGGARGDLLGAFSYTLTRSK